MKPVMILMVVVFPAPFGPRNPRISPFSTWNDIPSIAIFVTYRFVRFSTEITAA
jgi:hypothetical protein